MAYHALDISEICRMVTGFPLNKVVVFDTETTGVDTFGYIPSQGGAHAEAKGDA